MSDSDPLPSVLMTCTVCGGSDFAFNPVLWPGLVEEWGLTDDEARYIDRQQGEACVACGANLRSVVLATTVLESLGAVGTLAETAQNPDYRDVSILEINRAGTLTPTLEMFPRHTLVEFPDVDIHAMPFPNDSFDIVVHSDTLEHVADPVLVALRT